MTTAHSAPEKSVNSSELKMRGRKLHNEPEYAHDPRKLILEFLGDKINGFELACDMILVATYRRPELTEAGFVLTENELDEDKWQGKAGIILKLGSLAFVDDPRITHGGFKPELHDWITFDPAHGKQQEICGIHCRVLRDKSVLMRVEDPTLIW